jgi:hypothetical protein
MSLPENDQVISVADESFEQMVTTALDGLPEEFGKLRRAAVRARPRKTTPARLVIALRPSSRLTTKLVASGASSAACGIGKVGRVDAADNQRIQLAVASRGEDLGGSAAGPGRRRRDPPGPGDLGGRGRVAAAAAGQ